MANDVPATSPSLVIFDDSVRVLTPPRSRSIGLGPFAGFDDSQFGAVVAGFVRVLEDFASHTANAGLVYVHKRGLARDRRHLCGP